MLLGTGTEVAIDMVQQGRLTPNSCCFMVGGTVDDDAREHGVGRSTRQPVLWLELAGRRRAVTVYDGVIPPDNVITCMLYWRALRPMNMCEQLCIAYSPADVLEDVQNTDA
jgi:hypothetical protein